MSITDGWEITIDGITNPLEVLSIPLANVYDMKVMFDGKEMGIQFDQRSMYRDALMGYRVISAYLLPPKTKESGRVIIDCKLFRNVTK